jgi:predicted GIY-YIG superfamily endonuclease
MSIENRTAALRRSTSVITRDRADLNGPRLITDEASTVCVRVFPVAAIGALAATGALSVVSTYLLRCRHQPLGYVGSASDLDSRLRQHAADPDKAFASEVFAICGAGGDLDYETVVHMEGLLKRAIEEAGVARLVNKVEPRAARLSGSRLISVERQFADAQALLHDAGLHWLVPNPAPIVIEAAETPPAPEVAEVTVEEEAEDEGPMEIGVTVVPIGVEEQSLAFGGLWARGYQYGDRFIVAAGSEMRREATPSANEHTRERRERLTSTGTAKLVEGRNDRFRLEVAVAFPSKAIAAKCLAGAHVGSEKWRALRAERPCVIAH